MMTITHHAECCYAHRLLSPISNLHGHTVRVDVTCRSDGDAPDEDDLAKTTAIVLHKLDHRVILEHGDPLIEVLTFGAEVVVLGGPPTAERIAEYIGTRLAKRLAITNVTVNTTEHITATWHPDGDTDSLESRP
jgi:6-pyruvoyl-tetrahydropterin synthase